MPMAVVPVAAGENIRWVAWKMLVIKVKLKEEAGREGWLRKKFRVGRGFRLPHGDQREKNSHPGCL